ncbi:MAG: lipase [Oscillospiraceae bacterium]|jgi:triacylglycerol lipase|nr:lipase [Oscillospiraceae bacterium]
MIQKLIAFFLSFLQLFGISLTFGGRPTVKDPKDCAPVVLVHGFAGWGEEDGLSSLFSYWGLTSGQLVQTMADNGYEGYQASVGPFSSAWDRACELYAQLAGGRVDYGEAHAKEHGHNRYGRSYEAFFDWSASKKVNLIGHSFGGVTVRLFAQLCVEGAAAERAATPADQLSPLFSGTLGGRVNSITTLASPHNGVTGGTTNDSSGVDWNISALLGGALGSSHLLSAFYDPQLDHFGITTRRVKISQLSQHLAQWQSFTKGTDNASYDLSVHGAYLLNQFIKTQPDITYFSYTGNATNLDAATGNYLPQNDMFLPFLPFAKAIGAQTPFTSQDGIVVDATWRQSDGLVPVVSGLYPFGEAHQTFNAASIPAGIWNVMPTEEGWDHLDFVGSIGARDQDRLFAFYLTHLGYLTNK